MFTGIVEETGTVLRIDQCGEKIRLVVRSARCAEGVRIGDSVAVNGCCLTVVAQRGRRGAKELSFDLLEETWKRTNLRFSVEGCLVNLERALAVGDRFGGHFVTGHVDGMGLIRRFERSGADHVLDVKVPQDILRHLVFKGSIALDGISLTVAEVRRTLFRVWIIPHTLEVTALKSRKVGDFVNLESDLLGKYVDRLLLLRRSQAAGKKNSRQNRN